MDPTLEDVIKVLIKNSKNITLEERIEAERIISKGHSRDFYLGMVEAFTKAILITDDRLARRQISVLAAIAACLSEESFPTSV